MEAGWHADPAGRHQYRYHDGSSWTDTVADAGVQSEDAATPGPPPSAALSEHPLAAGEPAATDPNGRRTGRFDLVLRRVVRVLQPIRGGGPRTRGKTRPEDPPAEWVELTLAVALAATKLSPGSEVLLAAVTPFVGLGAAQAHTLKAIQRSVGVLVAEPLKSSEELLRDASRLPDGAERIELIKAARLKLVEAKTCAQTPAEEAIAAARLGAVWLVLGQPDAAQARLIEARGCSDEEVAYLLERANDTTVWRGWRKTYLLLLFYFYPFYWIPKKFAMVWKAERVLPAIRAQLEFQRGVAHVLDHLGSPHATALHNIEDCLKSGQVRLVPA